MSIHIITTKKFLIIFIPVSIILISLFLIDMFVRPISTFKNLLGGEQNINIRCENNPNVLGDADMIDSPIFLSADLVKKAEDKLIADKVSFFEADLASMRLTYFKNGEKNKEFQISAKGRPQSAWETPTGLYEIRLKEPVHYSKLSKVYMPWSMQFQGNFFMHGWPYDANGNPVNSVYSGGCMRFAKDAEAIYKLGYIGMPVVVLNELMESDDFAYPPKNPEVTAQSFLVADLKNDTAIVKKDIDKPLPADSVTKIVAGLAAMDLISFDKDFYISSADLVKTPKPRLKANTRMMGFSLLDLLLLESSNEAILALSRPLGQQNFINRMNEKARAIGMDNSKFVEPTGVLEGNTTTVEDVFSLAKHLHGNRRYFLNKTSGEDKPTSEVRADFPDIKNMNLLETHKEQFDGGVFGTTNTGKEVMFAVFNVDIKGVKRPLVVIVMESENAKMDVVKLLEWVEANY